MFNSWTCQMCDIKSSNGCCYVLAGSNSWTQIVQVPVFRQIRQISLICQKNFGKPKILLRVLGMTFIVVITLVNIYKAIWSNILKTCTKGVGMKVDHGKRWCNIFSHRFNLFCSKSKSVVCGIIDFSNYQWLHFSCKC